MYDPLSRELEELTAATPSPEFLARARARLVDEPALVPIVWRRSWLSLGAAAAAVMAAAVWWPATDVPTRRTIERPVAQSSRAVEAGPRIAALPPPALTAFPQLLALRPFRRPSPVRREAPSSAPVVVAPDEAEALRDLLSAISQRRLEPSVLPESVSVAMPLPLIEPITLEPLRVDPLPELQ
jgi:hypothetical protein